MRHGTLRLLSLREQTESVAEDMAIERGRFERLANREACRAVSAFNLFQTPPDVAARLAGRLDLADSSRVLEPSAGLGMLYRAVRDCSGCHVTLVEQSAECCAELYRETAGDDAARLVQGDFLAVTPDRIGTFDAVLMNPPFKMGADTRHVRHALGFVRPGGRLVAIVANGPRQRELRDMADDVEILPRGTFEATRVEAAILTINV